MSDQSPWGTPPPSNPYGTPSQPQQPPAQPPAQPPSQPSYGGGGGGGGLGGPSYGVPLNQGPKPPRRTGLIIGVVAAVLLVAAAFTVTLLVAGGDKEPEEGRSSDTATDSSGPTDDTSSDDSPTDETSTEETPTDETSSVAPADGDRITGNGYSFALPGIGWEDATDEKETLGASTIDTIAVLGSSLELSQSSIIVEALSSGSATSPEDLEGLWKRNLSSSDDATPVDIDEITIDGERAIGIKIDDRVNRAGVPIKQIAYLALHDGQQFSIGLSYPASGDSTSVSDLERMLASWTWSS